MKYLAEICRVFELGTPRAEATRVYGGLLHIMWRVDTDKRSYAVKQLSQDIDLNDENVRRNYELTERIAAGFCERGIAAVSALEMGGGEHLLEIDGTGFLVYRWVNGRVLDEDAISEWHARQIAEVIARMHLINLEVSEIEGAQFDVHTNEALCELFSKARDCKCCFANELKKLQDDILVMNDRYHDAMPLLKRNSVVSHGDLDQKNVLWDGNGNPILIDWESARKVNPTYEIVNASLDWSGITKDNFDEKQFVKMIQAYTTAGGIIDTSLLRAAFYGVLGNWINWMVYNIKRSCAIGETDQKKLGIEQVNQVLRTIVRLNADKGGLKLLND